MAEGREVTVVGSVCVDLVVQAERLPRAGETVVGGTFRQTPGGKGANQAVAAARMGAAVRFEGAVGDDAHGEWLRSELEREGVDCAGLRVVDAPTGVSVLQVDAAGENQISQASGANALVRPGGRYDLCVMTLETPFEPPRAALFLLNAAPARPIDVARVDVLIANRLEAEELTDAPTPEEAHGRLLGAGVGSAVVTLGADGAYDGAFHAPFAVTPIDTVGAGDAFVGAYAAALALGLDDPIRWAQASAALACTGEGAMSSPTRARVEAFLAPA